MKKIYLVASGTVLTVVACFGIVAWSSVTHADGTITSTSPVTTSLSQADLASIQTQVNIISRAVSTIQTIDTEKAVAINDVLRSLGTINTEVQMLVGSSSTMSEAERQTKINDLSAKVQNLIGKVRALITVRTAEANILNILGNSLISLKAKLVASLAQ